MAWSAVLASPYNSTTASVFALRDSQRSRIDNLIAYEWGIDAPGVPPVIAGNSLTGLTGDYNAVYTYGRVERQTLVCESNPSAAAGTAVALTNDGLTMTATDPKDTQVNVVRFYRTTANGTTFYYTGQRYYCNALWAATHDWEEDAAYFPGVCWRFTATDGPNGTEDCYLWELVYGDYTLNDGNNCITSPADNDLDYADNLGDTSLGTTAPEDHNRPPAGTFVFGPSQNGTIFLLKDHRCHYNKPQRPEYWPSTYYVDVSSVQYPLVCGCFYDGLPYLFDRRNIYYLAGTQFADLPDLTTYRPYPQEARGGALSAFGIESVLGLGIFHLVTDGIYRFMPSGDGSGLDELVSDPIGPIFRGESLGGIPAVGDLAYAWLQWYRDKLYFGYPSGADSYPRNVIVMDFVRKRVTFFAYPTAMATVCHDRWFDRFLACGEAGNLLQIEDDTAQGDGSTPIAWEIETKEFVLQTRKHYPRWNKYDVDASNASAAVAASYLNGAEVHAHTISGDRNTVRRLLPIANGNRFSVRLTGIGAVKIYAVESE